MNKIVINKTPNADTRTAVGEVTKAMLLDSSKQHIAHVRQGCEYFADMLLDVGEQHDWTKISFLDQFYEDSQTGKTGVDFKSLPWFQQHLQERHHLNDRCPDDVNLIDVLERVIDITMAGMSRSGAIYDAELDADILVRAYKNTVKLLAAAVELEE